MADDVPDELRQAAYDAAYLLWVADAASTAIVDAVIATVAPAMSARAYAAGYDDGLDDGFTQRALSEPPEGGKQ